MADRATVGPPRLVRMDAMTTGDDKRSPCAEYASMALTTPERFEREYAERSGRSVAEIRSYRKVVPCDCDYEECEGWGVVSLDSDTCGECGHYDFHHRDDLTCSCGCPGFTTERRWPRGAHTDGSRP